MKIHRIILLTNLYSLYEKQIFKNSKCFKKDSFLKKIAENFDIMNLIINDFKRYIKNAKKTPKSMDSPEKAVNSPENLSNVSVSKFNLSYTKVTLVIKLTLRQGLS